MKKRKTDFFAGKTGGDCRTLVSIDEYNVRIADDYDKQRLLFRNFGYDNPGPFLMGHYMIQMIDGERMKLVKREKPVNFEFDNNGHARCVKSMQKTYADRLGGLDIKPLKDSDTMRAVVDNLLCQSIEVGEVVGFANI